MFERREEERRKASTNSPSVLAGKVKTIACVALITSLMIWNWRYIIFTPLWVGRAWRADRTDIYMGKTNGVPNLQLVQQSRSYLKDLAEMDASGNFTRPEILRTINVRVKSSWFERHPPEIVDYNPFVTGVSGNFIVSWVYVPGCQKPLGKYGAAGGDWYDLQGQPCHGVCRVSVLMAPNLKLISIKLDPLL